MPRASKANIQQSKTAVNAHAGAPEPMPKLAGGAVAGQTGSWDDLGGPTPENYKPDDNSAELDDPGEGLKRVNDVIRKHKGHKDGDQTMPKLAPGAVKGVAEDAEYDEDEEIVEACDDEDDKDKDVKSSSKNSNEEEEEDEDGEEESYNEAFDVEDDVNALVENEDLSEEFKVKAKTIFEAALRSKVSQIQESMEAQYQEALLEEVQVIKEELTDRVDSYLEYVAEEWLYENQLSVTRGLKEELTQSFLSGLKALCEDHYVELPEEKYDVLENMVNKLDEMETKLNEQIEKNVYLNQQLSESVADQIFNSVSSGLAVTQKEKLASLAESVEFESEDQYRDKLVTLRESYFPTRSAAAYSQPETLSEGVDYDPSPYQQVSDSMSMYLQAASLLAKH